MNQKIENLPEHQATHSPERGNTDPLSLPQKIKLGMVGAVLLGAGAAFADHKIDEHREGERLQAETREDLIEKGARLSLASGKVVTIKGLDFTQKQISKAFDNQDNKIDTHSRDAKPFAVVTEKTKVESEGGGLFLLPGSKGTLLPIPVPGDSETSVVAYDDVVLANISSDHLNREDLEVYVASTEDVTDVAAQVFYDEESEDLILRAFYGPESPNDRLQYLVAIEGTES